MERGRRKGSAGGTLAAGAGALAAAHLALSLSSLIALKATQAIATIATTVFGALLAYGIAGFLVYAVPDMHCNVIVIKFLTLAQISIRNLALPCVLVYLYGETGHSTEVAYVHFVSGFLPVVLFVMKSAIAPFTDFNVAFNIMSLLYVSYAFGSAWGCGLAVCQFLNHFLLNHIKDHLEAPVDCLYVVGMCFFNIFAVKTMKEC